MGPQLLFFGVLESEQSSQSTLNSGLLSHAGADNKCYIWESWVTSAYPESSHEEPQTVSCVNAAGIGLFHKATGQAGERQAGSGSKQSSRHF